MLSELQLVGRRIKFLRLEKGMGQTALAKEIGLSQTNLSNIERGKTNATLQNLFKIHQVLDVPMSSFFIDIDGAQQHATKEIALEDAVKILQILKGVDVKGV